MKNRSRKCLIAVKIIAIIILVIMVALMMYGTSDTESQKPVEEKTVQEAKPLVIETPEPCTTGRVTVQFQGEVLYQYGGDVNIVNDGKDGNEIEIVIEYPEDYQEPQL